MSVLGTNDYLPCSYFFGNNEVTNVRFVQEATVQMLCGDWTSRDRVVIFTTEESRRRNWVDNGHIERETEQRKQCSGLKRCIEALDLNCVTANVSIPQGCSEEEIWEIFRIIEKHIPPEVEVFFDITHSFRSLPMLAMTALNYAKTVKKISIGGIYYGALEALGDMKTVAAMLVEKRRVPIFDLTAFDQLLDWAMGIDRFVSSGDARYVDRLARRSVKTVLAKTKGRDKAAAGVKKLGSHLADFTEILSTCRGKQIKDICGTLQEDLSAYRRAEHAAAFDPLVGRVADRMSRFKGEHVNDGIQAVRWCLGHNLIQQGYTILLETIVTAVLISISADIMDRDARMAVPGAAIVLNRGGEGKKEDQENRFYIQSRHYLEKNTALVKPITTLINLRNDLNHAGWRKNASKPHHFRIKLEHLVDEVEPLLKTP
jgi:CRISPR-associated Csx2 family protein